MEAYLTPEVLIQLKAAVVLLLALVTLTGIRVYQNARSNHWLRSIDRSLKMLPGVARADRRAA